MSRQRDAIKRALEAAGIAYRSIEWEPLGKSEPSGGWSVIGPDHEYLGGSYDAASLVRAINDAAARPDSESGWVNGRTVVTGLDPDSLAWIERPVPDGVGAEHAPKEHP